MRYTLLIETNDEKGLVYKVSKILFEHDLNIEKNSEFVDSETSTFFMRTVFSSSSEKEIDTASIIQGLNAVLPKDSIIKLSKTNKKDIVILCTKEAHCLGDLLVRYIENELYANVKAVISNHTILENFVNKFDIPYHYVSVDNLTREEHEDKISQIIDSYKPDILVLAKYMRILTPNFTKKYKNKTLNIHHSFLPAFIGANPYKQAHARGVKIIGATAHIVTDDLDEGPIIFQDVTRIDHSYSWKEMQQAGRDVEKVVLSKALKLLLEDRVFIKNNKTVIL
jgi:formyltetrahydrofolate deformylase